MAKTSRYRGVSWYPRLRKWRASLGHQGKTITLGYFETEVEAARSYNNARLIYKGAADHPQTLNDVEDGMSYLETLGKRKACIQWHRQFVTLGLFDSQAEAQAAYDTVKRSGLVSGQSKENPHVELT